MDATGQIFQVSKFPNTLLFAIIPGMFRQNWTKIGQIYMPYKLAQSGCNPLKIKSEIKVHKQLTPHQEIAHLLKPQINGTMGPPGVNDNGSRFPDVNDDGSRFLGKSNPLQTCKEDNTILSKVAKAKGKTCGKNGKTAKCAEEQDNKLTDSFKIMIWGNCKCICIRAGTCIKKRKTYF